MMTHAPTRPLLGHGLPTLPGVAKGLAHAVIVSPENPSAWNEAIGCDPVLCVRLLRLGNSTFYGATQQVFSLERVIAILGPTLVRGAALTAPVIDGWDGEVPGPVQEIWIHSRLTARAAGHMALRLVGAPNLSTPEALYTAGLLHDIGKIQLLARQPQLYAEMLTRVGNDRDLGIAEADAFGMDHSELGGDLLEEWGLPLRFSMAASNLERGGLRAEYRVDLDLLRVAHEAAVTGVMPLQTGWVPDALVADTVALIEQWREEAQAFCREE